MKNILKCITWVIITITILGACSNGQPTEHVDTNDQSTPMDTPASFTDSDGDGGISESGGADETDDTSDADSDFEGTDISSQTDIAIYIEGYEWGPGVPKIILNIDGDVDRLSADNFTVNTNRKPRTITDIYFSDEIGNKYETGGEFIAIELETTSANSGSPFYYSMSDMFNHWVKEYPVAIKGTGFTLDGEDAYIDVSKDCIDAKICPATDAFNVRNTYTGTSTNPSTNEEESLTLQLAAYEPELLSGGEKNPLIVWLHGQGEAGTSDISLLGNEVTALAEEPIQSYFVSGSQSGAYVLVPTCSTYWMDEGDGRNGGGAGISRYTWVLMDAIEEYANSNPDIDTDRIYIGGCSNGGYMTMNMIVEFPEYFAAAYPICEAYSYYKFGSGGSDELWFTQEKAELLKDFPIWFVHSMNDSVVPPSRYAIPTYLALLEAGAENAWFSMFETIVGDDDPGASYMGHFSWIYLFNDSVTGVQDREAILSSTDELNFGFIADNNGGGSQGALFEGNTYNNIFEWLNAQHK